MRIWGPFLVALMVVPNASAGVVLPDEIPTVTITPSELPTVMVPLPQEAAPVAPACTEGTDLGRWCTHYIVETQPEELAAAVPADETPRPRLEDAPADDALPIERSTVVAPDFQSLPGIEPSEGPASQPDPQSIPEPPGAPAAAASVATGERLSDAALGLAIATAFLAGSSILLLKALLSFIALRRRVAEDSKSLRMSVFQAILKNPGIRHGALVQVIGRGNGSIEHHTQHLEAAGRIQISRGPGFTCYFVTGNMPSPKEIQLHVALTRTSRRLALEVGETPGIQLTQLARRLDLAVSTVHYHAAKLVGAGVLQQERGLSLTPAGKRLMSAASSPTPQ